jgi:hypothetical protein
MFLNLLFGIYAKNHLGGQEFQLQPLGVFRIRGVTVNDSRHESLKSYVKVGLKSFSKTFESRAGLDE